MPINEADATALVYVQGLAISCFNKSESRCETAIMRELEHDLTMLITKTVGGSEVSETLYEFSRTDASIEIEGIGNVDINGYEQFHGVNFMRTLENVNDPNDLRWIPDLEGEEFHDCELLPTERAESEYNIPLTPLYIKNALFYGKANSGYTNNRIEMDNKGDIISSNYFGEYGYKMGAKIIADTINISLEGSSGKEINLNAAPDTQYIILISNKRPGDDETSDFSEYYKVVYAQNGINFDLLKVVETGMYFCGKVFLMRLNSISVLS